MSQKTLICKEDLLDTVLDHFGVDLAYFGKDLQFCQEAIAMAPAVDAVEVVRCGKCKHRAIGDDVCLHPNRIGDGYIEVRDDGFCSYGERRSDG